MTDNSDPKQSKPWQFQPGQSGNPEGKPKGARNKTTRALETLLEGEAQEIGRKVIEKAKGGNLVAARLVLERVVPPAKDRPITLDLPDVKTAEDVNGAIAAIIAAVASGDLTPSEAGTVAALVENQRRAIDLVELEARITALEKASTT